jgi:hypothetical protein
MRHETAGHGTAATAKQEIASVSASTRRMFTDPADSDAAAAPATPAAGVEGKDMTFGTAASCFRWTLGLVRFVTLGWARWRGLAGVDRRGRTSDLVVAAGVGVTTCGATEVGCGRAGAGFGRAGAGFGFGCGRGAGVGAGSGSGAVGEGTVVGSGSGSCARAGETPPAASQPTVARSASAHTATTRVGERNPVMPCCELASLKGTSRGRHRSPLSAVRTGPAYTD